ncbi:MAG: hypothetical protein ACRDUY_13410 [Nitriliruptorales bacterium]
MLRGRGTGGRCGLGDPEEALDRLAEVLVGTDPRRRGEASASDHHDLPVALVTSRRHDLVDGDQSGEVAGPGEDPGEVVEAVPQPARLLEASFGPGAVHPPPQAGDQRGRIVADGGAVAVDDRRVPGLVLAGVAGRPTATEILEDARRPSAGGRQAVRALSQRDDLGDGRRERLRGSPSAQGAHVDGLWVAHGGDDRQARVALPRELHVDGALGMARAAVAARAVAVDRADLADRGLELGRATEVTSSD